MVRTFQILSVFVKAGLIDYVYVFYVCSVNSVLEFAFLFVAEFF